MGGDVPSVLNLAISSAGGSGTFVPGIATNYNTALAASVTTTTGNAALTVTDPDTVAGGYLVNGALKLASPLTIRALGLGDPASTAFTPLNTNGTPLQLKSWSSPVTAAPPRSASASDGWRRAPPRGGTCSRPYVGVVDQTP